MRCTLLKSTVDKVKDIICLAKERNGTSKKTHETYSKEHQTNDLVSMSTAVKMNATDILVFVLIFIILGIFGYQAFSMPDAKIGFAIMMVFSAAVIIAGGIISEKCRNAFGLRLTVCGISAMYITFLCGRFLFGLYGNEELFLLFLYGIANACEEGYL